MIAAGTVGLVLGAGPASAGTGPGDAGSGSTGSATSRDTGDAGGSPLPARLDSRLRDGDGSSSPTAEEADDTGRTSRTAAPDRDVPGVDAPSATAADDTDHHGAESPDVGSVPLDLDPAGTSPTTTSPTGRDTVAPRPVPLLTPDADFGFAQGIRLTPLTAADEQDPGSTERWPTVDELPAPTATPLHVPTGHATDRAAPASSESSVVPAVEPTVLGSDPTTDPDPVTEPAVRPSGRVADPVATSPVEAAEMPRTRPSDATERPTAGSTVAAVPLEPGSGTRRAVGLPRMRSATVTVPTAGQAPTVPVVPTGSEPPAPDPSEDPEDRPDDDGDERERRATDELVDRVLRDLTTRRTGGVGPGGGAPRFPWETDGFDSHEPVTYQYLPGPDGERDFVRTTPETVQAGHPQVSVLQTDLGPVFSVRADPTDEQSARLEVDTGTIEEGGSPLGSVVVTQGGQSPLPITRFPGSPDHLAAIEQEADERQRATRDTFTIPSDGENLRFGVELPYLRLPSGAESELVVPPRPDEARLNCWVGSRCYTFDSRGNLRVTGTAVEEAPEGTADAPTRPTVSRTFEHRQTEDVSSLPDRMPTPPVTWVFTPGTDGRPGWMTAYPGIQDPGDPSSVVWQLSRDDLGDTDWTRILGGSADPTADHGDLPAGRSWVVEAHNQAADPTRSIAIGENWTLQSYADDLEDPRSLIGFVEGALVDIHDPAAARAFTRLAGIPEPANPLNLEAWGEDRDASATLSASTDPAPVVIDHLNRLVWRGPDGTRYALSPDEHDAPEEPGGVARGTGTYRELRRGVWVPVDPADVPPLTGWGNGSARAVSEPPPDGVDPDRESASPPTANTRPGVEPGSASGAPGEGADGEDVPDDLDQLLGNLFGSAGSGATALWPLAGDGPPGPGDGPDAGSPDQITYQYLPRPDGGMDFVRTTPATAQPGRITVMIEPSSSGPVFRVLEDTEDPRSAMLDIDTSDVDPFGSDLAGSLFSHGGQSRLEVTRVPSSDEQAGAIGSEEDARWEAVQNTFTLPAGEQRLRFGIDLPYATDGTGAETDLVRRPLPGEARLTCVVNDGRCYTFDDVGNVVLRTAARETPPSSSPGPVTPRLRRTHDYRVTETPHPVPDRFDASAPPSMTWVFRPGTQDEPGSMTAVPGIRDSTDPASVAWQLERDATGRPSVVRVVGGFTDNTADRANGVPAGRSWMVEAQDPRTSQVPSISIGPNWDLDSTVNLSTGQQPLIGFVNGAPVDLPDLDVGRAFTRLVGIPAPANPANLDVQGEDPLANATLSGSTDPAPVRIDGRNWLIWPGLDEATGTLTNFGASPDEYEAPEVPGGVARGTGIYRQEADGSWVPADPATVPPLTGLWRREPPDAGSETGPEGGGAPDRGPGTDPPPGRPDGGRGDVPRVPDADGGSGGTASSGSRSGGVVVAPERQPPVDPRDVIFVGGRPGAPVELPDLNRPVRDRVDPAEFDPNRINDVAAVPDLAGQGPEGFPTRDRWLERALWPDGVPGVFRSPLGQEEPATAGGSVTGEAVAAPVGRSGGASSPALPPAAGTAVSAARSGAGSGVLPGATRVGSDGQPQQLVGSQVLVGDGGAGTVRGRVDFFQGSDGSFEAVVRSPYSDDGRGRRTVWIPNLGTSVASNPAGRTTSVQRVASAEYAPGTSVRAVQIRTAPHRQELAGGGPGSDPGSLAYLPVAGRPDLEDVVVTPSVTETVHPDGARTVVRSALVPVNRVWNTDGAAERFRVAVGTAMEQVVRSVEIPAPAPVQQPVAVSAPGWGGAPAGVSSPALRSTGGAPARSAEPGRAPARGTAPAPVPVSGPVEQEPTWQERAGQAAGVLRDVMTYPHPLDPARGALRGLWPHLIPGAAGGAERRWVY